MPTPLGPLNPGTFRSPLNQFLDNLPQLTGQLLQAQQQKQEMQQRQQRQAVKEERAQLSTIFNTLSQNKAWEALDSYAESTVPQFPQNQEFLDQTERMAESLSKRKQQAVQLVEATNTPDGLAQIMSRLPSEVQTGANKKLKRLSDIEKALAKLRAPRVAPERSKLISNFQRLHDAGVAISEGREKFLITDSRGLQFLTNAVFGPSQKKRAKKLARELKLKHGYSILDAGFNPAIVGPFLSRDDFVKDFEKEQGRPPTGDEIDVLRGVIWE